MVEPLLLLKMLHCRKKCQSSAKKGCSSIKTTLERIAINNREDVRVEPQTKCRVCLKEGSIPIFGDQLTEDVSDALITFGGIEIVADDDFPKYICMICQALLEGAILLRKTAQESQQLLKNASNVLTENTDDSAYADEGNSVDSEDTPEKQKSYNCKRCDIEFTTFKEYCEHRLSEEHENKRVTCPVCNKSYTAMYYKKHSAIHKPDCPFMCDICGKKFIVQGQFSRHRLTHFYKLPFKCSHCPYRGRFSESLKMHMRSHTGEKPYPCLECSARFVNKSNLNKHMFTHKGEHDYKCESCGKGFYTKRNLDLHIKVDHVGIKDHLCNLCGKAFGYRKQMMKHQLKVHKRQKLKSGRLPLYLQVEKFEGSVET